MSISKAFSMRWSYLAAPCKAIHQTPRTFKDQMASIMNKGGACREAPESKPRWTLHRGAQSSLLNKRWGIIKFRISWHRYQETSPTKNHSSQAVRCCSKEERSQQTGEGPRDCRSSIRQIKATCWRRRKAQVLIMISSETDLTIAY